MLAHPADSDSTPVSTTVSPCILVLFCYMHECSLSTCLCNTFAHVKVAHMGTMCVDFVTAICAARNPCPSSLCPSSLCPSISVPSQSVARSCEHDLIRSGTLQHLLSFNNSSAASDVHIGYIARLQGCYQVKAYTMITLYNSEFSTFMECTAMSMSSPMSMSSISFVKSPLPPMSARGWLSTLSPCGFDNCNLQSTFLCKLRESSLQDKRVQYPVTKLSNQSWAATGALADASQSLEHFPVTTMQPIWQPLLA